MGFDLNAQDPGHFGWTPLIGSIYFEFTNISSYLIGKTNVDVCIRDGTGQTALRLAIICNDINTGRLLVDTRRAELAKGEDWRMVRSTVAAMEDKEQEAWIVILNGLIEP